MRVDLSALLGEDKGPTNFPSELDSRYIDGRGWKILEPFEFRFLRADGTYAEFVRAGVGFITDFASIPRLLKVRWPSPGGPWDKPAVIHDCLYRTRRIENIDGSFRLCDRAEADLVLYNAMKVTGTSFDSRWLIYQGVRLGGWVPYRRYRKEEEDERRAGMHSADPPPTNVSAV